MLIVLAMGYMFYIDPLGIRPGRVNQAIIEIGESDRFTQDDLDNAFEAVKVMFRGFRGCRLIDLWYDEYFSSNEIIRMYGNVRYDTIILGSKIYISTAAGSASGSMPGIGPQESTYWFWMLRRDSISGYWIVASTGPFL
jgi:hypothetical protein